MELVERFAKCTLDRATQLDARCSTPGIGPEGGDPIHLTGPPGARESPRLLTCLRSRSGPAGHDGIFGSPTKPRWPHTLSTAQSCELRQLSPWLGTAVALRELPRMHLPLFTY
jgi:hypothetical protein